MANAGGTFGEAVGTLDPVSPRSAPLAIAPPGIAGYRSGILIECAVYPANPPRSLAGYSGRVGKKSVIALSEQEVVSELRFGMAGALAEWAANLPST